MTTKVQLDVDPGCDDAIMIAMALAHPSVEVVGMSTVGGNSTVENTTNNALALRELFDRTDVPVARGCEQPLVGSFETAERIHGPDGIRGDLPEPTASPIDAHAGQFIVEQAHTYGEDLTIVAVAPMTNLATALVLEPALPDLVDDIYLMGGAALTSGNATPMAEANFYNDAFAARRVVQSATPWMVGLDATYDATVSYSLVDEYAGRGSPLESIASWLDFPADIRAHAGGEDPAIHDAAVVAHLIDEDVLTFEPYHLDVDATGGPSHGAVICDERGITGREPNGQVAVSTDTGRFRAVVRDAFQRIEANHE